MSGILMLNLCFHGVPAYVKVLLPKKRKCYSSLEDQTVNQGAYDIFYSYRPYPITHTQGTTYGTLFKNFFLKSRFLYELIYLNRNNGTVIATNIIDRKEHGVAITKNEGSFSSKQYDIFTFKTQVI